MEQSAQVLFSRVFDNWVDEYGEKIKFKLKITANTDPHCYFDYLIQIFDSNKRYFEHTCTNTNFSDNYTDDLFANLKIESIVFHSEPNFETRRNDGWVEIEYRDGSKSIPKGLQPSCKYKMFIVNQEHNVYNLDKISKQIAELQEIKEEYEELFSF